MTPERIACLAFHFICGIPFGDLFRLPVLTCFLRWCQLERSLGFLFLQLLLLRIFIRVVDLLIPLSFPHFTAFLAGRPRQEAMFFCVSTFVPKDFQEEAPVLKTSMKRQLTDKRDQQSIPRYSVCRSLCSHYVSMLQNKSPRSFVRSVSGEGSTFLNPHFLS